MPSSCASPPQTGRTTRCPPSGGPRRAVAKVGTCKPRGDGEADSERLCGRAPCCCAGPASPRGGRVRQLDRAGNVPGRSRPGGQHTGSGGGGVRGVRILDSAWLPEQPGVRGRSARRPASAPLSHPPGWWRRQGRCAACRRCPRVMLRDAAPRPPHTRTPATPARGVQTRLTLARGVQTRLAVRKVKGPVCTPRKNRPERRSRLKESVVVSLSLPILFGRHRMRMTPCTPEQARTNRKITTMLHKRAILRANMRAEATGDRLSGMTLVSTRSSSDTRLNIPRCVLTRVLFSILWCDHSFLRVRTRSAACNSSGRRLHRGRQGVSARLLCLNVRCNDKSLRCSQSTAWRSLPPAHQVYGRSPKTCKR